MIYINKVRQFAVRAIVVAGAGFFLLSACNSPGKRDNFLPFQYEVLKDSVLRNDTGSTEDSENIFDLPVYTPGIVSIDSLIFSFGSLWYRELALMDQLDTLKGGIKKTPGFSPGELGAIKENIIAVDEYLRTRDSTDAGMCKMKECILYVEINKSVQTMYLYLLGELKDSFKVSTGKGKYETPDMNLRPSGPVFTKYNSRKFPGGNYEGFGNMPYAVFLRGGYAIHGTTPGNYTFLGTKASHGCIRLHPDNAKVFNTLVKAVGLDQTWISISDSFP
jgi:hypothetical protein